MSQGMNTGEGPATNQAMRSADKTRVNPESLPLASNTIVARGFCREQVERRSGPRPFLPQPTSSLTANREGLTFARRGGWGGFHSYTVPFVGNPRFVSSGPIHVPRESVCRVFTTRVAFSQVIVVEYVGRGPDGGPGCPAGVVRVGDNARLVAGCGDVGVAGGPPDIPEQNSDAPARVGVLWVVGDRVGRGNRVAHIALTVGRVRGTLWRPGHRGLMTPRGTQPLLQPFSHRHHTLQHRQPQLRLDLLTDDRGSRCTGTNLRQHHQHPQPAAEGSVAV